MVNRMDGRRHRRKNGGGNAEDTGGRGENRREVAGNGG